MLATAKGYNRQLVRARLAVAFAICGALLVSGADSAARPRASAAGGPDLRIAQVHLEMTAKEVRDLLGLPRAAARHGRIRVWRYLDTLVVYMGFSRSRHTYVVVGVTTKSPRDRVKRLKGIHVGSSEEEVVSVVKGELQTSEGPCFTAAVRDVLSVRTVGRFCQYPEYLVTVPAGHQPKGATVVTRERKEEPEEGVFQTVPPETLERMKEPVEVLLFTIARGHVTAISLEPQPLREPAATP
jgi:hypothetical protein